MKLLSLSLKNIFVNRWRSLTLGLFIFFISFLMIFFNSFVLTMQNNMRNALKNAFTDDVQIRSGNTRETDMAANNTNWDDIQYLDQKQVARVKGILQSLQPVSFTQRVRQNALLVSDYDKLPVMVIGLDTNAASYKKVFQLSTGRYLGKDDSNEVLLTVEQAKKLKVKVGDTIVVTAQTKDGYGVDTALTVAGIGNLQLLSSYQIPVVYMTIKSARELAGFEAGELTDIIIQTAPKENAGEFIKQLNSKLKQKGISGATLKLTSWEEMGGGVMGIINIYKVMFYAFIFVLFLVVCILIINLVYMMGLERRQEIGMLRAIGFGRFTIIRIFMCEILIITGFFCLVGIVAGILLILVFSNIGIQTNQAMSFAMGKRFFIQLDSSQIIALVVIILGFTFLAAFYPAFKAAGTKPVETLQEI